jgi:glycosyltransferase involved in cell wall biosynthesis
MPVSKKPKKLKVAIVHDWLIGGGAERVVSELHDMFPDAPIYTSYCTNEWRERLDGKVVTGFLQYWPFSKLRKFVGPLRIWWFTHLDMSGYDLVISSSGNGESFGVKTSGSTKHICYCHTPTHYYWRHYDQYMKNPGFGAFNPVARLGLRLLAGSLRRWDYKAAQRVDYFVANSTHIQSDIQKYYNRESIVIHPPVDIARFSSAKATKRSGFVTASRQVPAKHIGVIVEACSQLNLPLKVIGRGPEHQRLVSIAGPSVTFWDNVSDAEMPQHFADSKAFIFASYDDFGVVPVEAMAAGTPVIAYKAGGAFDYIKEGVTGEFFADQTADSLCKTLRSFNPKSYSSSAIHQEANEFSPEVFNRKFRDLIESLF